MKRARQLERSKEDGSYVDPLIEMPSTVRADKNLRRAYEEAAAEKRTGQFAGRYAAISSNPCGGMKPLTPSVSG